MLVVVFAAVYLLPKHARSQEPAEGASPELAKSHA
jgi:hypothetical protein